MTTTIEELLKGTKSNSSIARRFAPFLKQARDESFTKLVQDFAERTGAVEVVPHGDAGFSIRYQDNSTLNITR